MQRLLVLFVLALVAVTATAQAQETADGRRAAAQQLERKLAELAAVQAEVDELYRATGTTPQILLKVRILDIDHSKLDKVGFDFRTPDGTAGAKHVDLPAMLQQLSTGVPQQTAAKNAESNTMCVLPSNHPFLAFVDMLEKQQLATTVCEPNVATYSGLPASYRSGGEFPVAAGTTATAATMKFYGTDLGALVQATGNGRLQINFRAEVSELDPSRAVTLGKLTVPGLLTSSFETTFAAQPGETFVSASMNRQRRVETRRNEHEYHRFTRLCLVTPHLLSKATVAVDSEAAAQRR